MRFRFFSYLNFFTSVAKDAFVKNLRRHCSLMLLMLFTFLTFAFIGCTFSVFGEKERVFVKTKYPVITIERTLEIPTLSDATLDALANIEKSAIDDLRCRDRALKEYLLYLEAKIAAYNKVAVEHNEKVGDDG